MKTVSLTISLNSKEQPHFDGIMAGVSSILEVKPNERESGMIIQHAKGVYTNARWQPVYNGINFSDEKLHVNFSLSEKKDKEIRKFLLSFTKNNNMPFNKRR